MKDLLLITANVGSLFGDKSGIRAAWMKHMLEAIGAEDAHFVAIHMQESGGKTFKVHSKEVPGLVEELYEHLKGSYALCRAYLDTAHERSEEYTALSSVFFVHDRRLASTGQYNFASRAFAALRKEDAGLQIHTDLNKCAEVRKEKFARDFWPTFHWGRKGYLHARWTLDGRVLDIVNLHLFHDESNLTFLDNPSEYSDNRKHALEYVLEKLADVQPGANGFKDSPASQFIFGDFNFRLDLGAFVKKLTRQTTEREELEQAELEDGEEKAAGGSSSDTDPSGELDEISERQRVRIELIRRKSSVIEYRQPHAGCVLRIGKKRFDFHEAHKLADCWPSYREDDRESGAFPQLREAEIRFPPTYPWSEDAAKPNALMNTRGPAWCDRVLMNEQAWRHLDAHKLLYTSLGQSVCTGDHKPVMLAVAFKQ